MARLERFSACVAAVADDCGLVWCKRLGHSAGMCFCCFASTLRSLSLEMVVAVWLGVRSVTWMAKLVMCLAWAMVAFLRGQQCGKLAVVAGATVVVWCGAGAWGVQWGPASVVLPLPSEVHH